MKGTDSALAESINYIEANALRGNKKHCIGVYMDISGAFDGATYEEIIKSMKKSNAPAAFVNFYSNFLYNRQTTIEMGSHQKTKSLIVG